MKFRNGLVVSLALISFATFAAEVKDAPLWPGTKIIPGDPAKNEFFIVAQNDIPKIIKSLSKKTTKTPQAKHSKELATQTSISRSKKIVPKIKIALREMGKHKNKSTKKIFLTDSKMNRAHHKPKKNSNKITRVKNKKYFARSKFHPKIQIAANHKKNGSHKIRKKLA